MRLVVDLQGAQGINRDRDIGRYCLSLTRALARHRGGHEMIVVLSALFPDTIEPLRRSLEGVLPPDAIRIMHLAGPVPDAQPHCDARREAAEIMREHFIASLEPDFVLILSLFEGLDDDVVTSIGRFSTQIPTAAVLYDYILPVNRGILLQNPAQTQWYERKLAHLRSADLLLTVSQWAQREAIAWLDAGENESADIAIGVEDHFTPAPVGAERRAVLTRTYGLVRPFIMCIGDIGRSDDIEGLIEAYAMLSPALRQGHQLAILHSVPSTDWQRLMALAAGHGLGSDELVLTGHLPDDDLLACYRACKLFVLPTGHEEIGLSGLQAMRCGRAVIASDRSGLRDVIGMSEALFDPHDVAAISRMIGGLLSDDVLRTRVQEHEQAQIKRFNWDGTAQAAWDAIMASHDRRTANATGRGLSSRKPRLAYVSPLPPAPGQISDYGAELLPELARHYRIDIIADQQEISNVAIAANHPVRSVDWFRRHAHAFDRILCHFGNSHSHSYMFDLIADYPAMVVLHDFFLSGVVAHRDLHGEDPGGWARALFEGHGWPAVVHRFKAADMADVLPAYPCNIGVLQNALGVIVHADFPRQLAQTHYGRGADDDWALVPYLRQPAALPDRAVAREFLGLDPDDFVVCGFGAYGPVMMSDPLLSAWLASPLADNPACHLIFGDRNDQRPHNGELERRIRACRSAGRIEIASWADRTILHHWLAAADIGVQLRAISCGETSVIVLDAMNMGLPIIVNANGSMAELPADCVWLMPDDFSDEDLVEALSTLYVDTVRRSDMGERARAWVARHNNPRRSAAAYAEAIEAAYARAEVGQTGLERALTEQGEGLGEGDWCNIAQAMGRNAPPTLRRKKLLVDISELVQRDLRSGIQRVVRSILAHWLPNPPAHYIVEPVYAVLDEPGYRYARRFTSQMLDIPPFWCEDEVVEPMAGDIFVGIDLQPVIVPQQKELLQEWRRMGVVVRFVVHDLLPVLRPEFFGPGAKAGHHVWLEAISHFDGVICVSRTVANEYRDWLDHYGPSRVTPLEIDWFHHGCDIEKQPTRSSDMPDDAPEMLVRLRNTTSFLSVSTIEPRKGFRQTLDAMEMLWAKGVEINFVIVGRSGWMMDDFIARLQSHAELGNRLFWLRGISDAYLHAVYGSCRYLIAASEGEGFGLPLVEAARHDLPVLARDITVFREVAGDAATYFPDSGDPAVLAQAIEALLRPQKSSARPRRIKSMTWAQSADALLARAMRRDAPYLRWMPDGVLRFWGNDHRLQSQVGVVDGTHIRTSAQAGFLVFGPYIPLDAGSWIIKAEGEATHLNGSEIIEIVSNGGEHIHFSAALTRVGERWVTEGDYGLDKRAEGIEIRLRVSDATILSLARISLTPSVIQAVDDREAVWN